MIVDDQEDALAFLSQPAAFGRDGAVERMETHISRIFLVAGRAYKMKRAVHLPYLDFSTPAIRLAACEKEVALNSPTAPGLYLGVRRIVRRPDGVLALDGDGDLVEPLIEMRRFPQDQLLDAIATAGGLTPRLMEQVVATIADFHRTAPIARDEGGADNLAAVLDINRQGFATSRVFSNAEVSVLDRAFRDRLERHRRHLDRRAEAGLVRRCHGDLHLRNICMFDGLPRLFDCIEFNDRIATVDVLYDLAFLVMDLWHRGFAGFANLCANRYLDAMGDAEGHVLLPFLMAIRAAVRAHVTATQVAEGSANADALVAEARSYADLAKQLLAGQPPRLVVIGGFSGSGKTSVAEALAPWIGIAPGARIIESDRIRKALRGVHPETRLAQDAYSSEMSDRVYAEMLAQSRAILTDGGSVVVDAVFDDPQRRRMIEGAGEAAGAKVSAFWLDVDPSVLRARIRARQGGPSDATVEVLAAQIARGAGDVDWRRVPAGDPLPQIIETIRALIV